MSDSIDVSYAVPTCTTLHAQTLRTLPPVVSNGFSRPLDPEPKPADSPQPSLPNPDPQSKIENQNSRISPSPAQEVQEVQDNIEARFASHADPEVAALWREDAFRKDWNLYVPSKHPYPANPQSKLQNQKPNVDYPDLAPKVSPDTASPEAAIFLSPRQVHAAHLLATGHTLGDCSRICQATIISPRQRQL